ncbi:MAG: nucleotide 5'-monophosphate nucleosidase PpnN [Hydrogenovibrio sp.]|nr:nucleotide 5'-monophosphate nucleosidase PpnN [Hydrogenovibrio sp.]
MNNTIKKALIRPSENMQILSYQEAEQLCDATQSGLNELFRRCTLAVLNTGTKEDNGMALLEAHPDFGVHVYVKGRGIQIEIDNPPEDAFVDGELIVGLQEHLSVVIRDLIYSQNKIINNPEFDLDTSYGITNAVFHLARNANLMRCQQDPNIVVCWGGHSISLEEYKYTKRVGYELGLRQFDICTGCGPGAMKGPMKGAVLGHGKQRHKGARYIGLTEPGIIAAEAPNAIVSELAILPDIEKRLEAFLRLGHGVVIFPGGAGTMEEILYLLSVLLHPKNEHIPFPVVLTSPRNHEAYFDAVLDFIETALGTEARNKLTLVHEDAETVAHEMKKGILDVRAFRKSTSDAYYFNWNLHIPFDLQQPFFPTHEAIAELKIDRSQPTNELASHLRKVFSAIVAGNVKSEGIQQVAEKGPFQIHGDPEIMQRMDKLLRSFVEQRRMKLGTEDYVPCYNIVLD